MEAFEVEMMGYWEENTATVMEVVVIEESVTEVVVIEESVKKGGTIPRI